MMNLSLVLDEDLKDSSDIIIHHLCFCCVYILAHTSRLKGFIFVSLKIQFHFNPRDEEVSDLDNILLWKFLTKKNKGGIVFNIEENPLEYFTLRAERFHFD